MLPVPSPEPVIRLHQVTKRFAGGTEALAGLDLAVAPGELLALLGPSGCGKSTALRLMAGLTAPTTGSVERHLPASQTVGFVFQEPTLMPWATVEQNISLPLKLLGLPGAEIRRRVGERLERSPPSPFSPALECFSTPCSRGSPISCSVDGTRARRSGRALRKALLLSRKIGKGFSIVSAQCGRGLNAAYYPYLPQSLPVFSPISISPANVIAAERLRQQSVRPPGLGSDLS